MTIEVLEPFILKTKTSGPRSLAAGERIDLPEHMGKQVLEKAKGKVRLAEDRPRKTPPPPLKKGWQVIWRDQEDILREGIVDHLKPRPGNRWMVFLKSGESIPSNIIRSVACIEHGKKVAAWLVKPHGLGGPPPDTWQRAWRKLAALVDGIQDDDARFSTITDLVEACDEAFEKGDYQIFHKHLLRIENLTQNHKP